MQSMHEFRLDADVERFEADLNIAFLLVKIWMGCSCLCTLLLRREEREFAC